MWRYRQPTSKSTNRHRDFQSNATKFDRHDLVSRHKIPKNITTPTSSYVYLINIFEITSRRHRTHVSTSRTHIDHRFRSQSTMPQSHTNHNQKNIYLILHDNSELQNHRLSCETHNHMKTDTKR